MTTKLVLPPWTRTFWSSIASFRTFLSQRMAACGMMTVLERWNMRSTAIGTLFLLQFESFSFNFHRFAFTTFVKMMSGPVNKAENPRRLSPVRVLSHYDRPTVVAIHVASCTGPSGSTV